MVVLTDGDIFEDPLNLTTVINSPKMQGVERFAIGVSAKSWGEALPTLCSLGWGGARFPDRGFCKLLTQALLYSQTLSNCYQSLCPEISPFHTGSSHRGPISHW